eukprot:404940-Pleurochrysis_carterae.AAC.1
MVTRPALARPAPRKRQSKQGKACAHRLVLEPVREEPAVAVVGRVVDKAPLEELKLVLQEPAAELLAAAQKQQGTAIPSKILDVLQQWKCTFG